MSALIWPPRQRDEYDRWYPPDWTDQALCAQVGDDLWFPEKGGSVRLPKRICSGCPVREPCLEYALETSQMFGVWGGMTEQERRRIKRQPAVPVIPVKRSQGRAA